MKKIHFSIFLVVIIMCSTFAGVFMEYFHARNDAENIRLEWKTGDEVNLKEFIIERKTQQTSYVELTSITPKGSNSFYTYIDESVYKSSSYVFTYRLKIVDQDLQISYSQEVSVSPNPSDVKRTWGSIKAMFR